MNYYWFSFSNEGSNVGVCIVQEEDEIKALQKTSDLNIHPDNNSIACFVLKNLESGMELNKLYSKEEMINKSYKPINSTVKI